MDGDRSRLEGAIRDAWNFPLFKAIFQRRSRRVPAGGVHPGDFTYHQSTLPPRPLDKVEEALLVSVGVGLSGRTLLDAGYTKEGTKEHWMGQTYVGFTGRTFASPCNSQATELFFTNDSGSYLTRFRGAAMPERMTEYQDEGDVERLLRVFDEQTVKLSDGRLNLPPELPHIPPMNAWNVNLPGTTLFVPVSDISIEYINLLLTMFDDGLRRYIWDDYTGKEPLKKYADQGILRRENGLPLSYFERMVTNVSAQAEQAIIIQNMFLAIQAIGLGGWLFSGLGANSLCQGFGFRMARSDKPGPLYKPDYIKEEYLEPIGLDGYMETRRPPYYPTMDAAVQSVIDEKFGACGTYKNAAPYTDKAPTDKLVRRHDDHAVEITKVLCSYIWDTYGKFPALVAPIQLGTYFQAHNLAIDYYDKFYPEGSVPESIRDHAKKWYGDDS